MEQRLKQIEEESRVLRETEEALRRQNEYLTALHETSLGLIDRLDKEELLEAILFHRHNIRSKLRLKNKKINLRSHLLSYDK